MNVFKCQEHLKASAQCKIARESKWNMQSVMFHPGDVGEPGRNVLIKYVDGRIDLMDEREFLAMLDMRLG